MSQPLAVKTPRRTEKRTVFISYSLMEHDLAKTLCHKLEENGLSVWYAPRDVETDRYAASVREAIEQCDVFIVILSKYSMHSLSVMQEVRFAFERLKRDDDIIMIPLRTDTAELPSEINFLLGRFQILDSSQWPIEASLNELVEFIKQCKKQ